MNQTETTKIPWYRTRLFWEIAIGVLIIGGIVFFSQLYLSQTSLLDKVEALLLIPGAATIVFLAQGVFENSKMLDTISLILYYSIAALLLYLAFRKRQAQLFYTLVFILNLLLSFFLIYYLLSGL